MRILLGVLLLCFAADMSLASEGLREHTVQVSGNAEVKAMPDMAHLSLTAYGKAKELPEAKKQADALLAKVKSTLSAQGVEKEAVHTTAIRVNPSFRWLEGGRQQLEHYEASYDVHVQIAQLEKVGVIVQQLVVAGIDRINQVQYVLKDSEQAKQQALAKAVGHAKAKAMVLAKAANRALGDALIIQEAQSHYHSPAYPMARAMAMEVASDKMAGEAPPVGELDINAQVTIIYELKN